MIAPRRHVALVGPRCSGKSTVGRALADLFGVPLVDLDDEVLRRANETAGGAARFQAAGEVLATWGEPAFRSLESQVLREVLGYEGRYVGTTEFVRTGEPGPLLVPATFRITSTRLEAGVGDRLSPVPQQELVAYVPHPPAAAVEGRIVSIYGEGVNAGQNQVVAINRGKRDGIERGNVLALWRAGQRVVDNSTPGERTMMQLPDERHGLLFVFRVFERVSYALILNVQEPVSRGDRFTQP